MSIAGFYTATKLVYFKAITPIHLGVGRAVGEPVDLPIQKDEFGIPIAWGSSIKGALRSFKELKANSPDEKKRIEIVFGPERPEHASCLSILDARLVMIPARSLRGLYAYITSRHMLEYLRQYIEVALSSNPELESRYSYILRLIEIASRVPENTVFIPSDTITIGEGVVLNEMTFKYKTVPEIAGLIKKVFSGILPEEELGRILMISDDDLLDIIRTSLLVMTRIKLDYEKKKVETGPWSEEYLPSGSLLVSLILYSTPRVKQGSLTLDQVWEIINPGKYLILGGGESIGKGIVEVITV